MEVVVKYYLALLHFPNHHIWKGLVYQINIKTEEKVNRLKMKEVAPEPQQGDLEPLDYRICQAAVGYRPPGRDRVAVSGTDQMQTRPGGQYED